MRFDTRFRFGWALVVASFFTLGLAGCEGDDGSDGRDGRDGVDGMDGADGADGAGVVVLPLESCSVCHDDGSFADAAVAHALPPIESVSNISFATVNAGADLAVTSVR